MSQPKRVPNFTSSEKFHLLTLLAEKYGKIIEDKKTDRASTVLKEQAWKDVEAEFNAASSSSIFRNAASLRKCYVNRKKELRKTLADEKKEALLTGGGPPPKKIKDNDESAMDNILLSILNEKTVVGLQNAFDDDSDYTEINHNTSNSPIEFIFERNSNIDNGNDFADIPNTSGVELDELSQSLLKWKKLTPVHLQEPISAPLAFKNTTFGPNSIPKSDNINKQTVKNLKRRRPNTIVKTMTSSDIAKKYNILLDKRLVLLDEQLKHEEIESALRTTKLQLEIEILELDLKSKKKF